MEQSAAAAEGSGELKLGTSRQIALKGAGQWNAPRAVPPVPWERSPQSPGSFSSSFSFSFSLALA
eukprot:3011616-Pyramimonas_sp.AAC.1